MDPVTMKLIDGDVQAHTVSLKIVRVRLHILIHRSQHQCIRNLGAILEAAGSSLDKVVKVNVFLSSMDDFAKVSMS